MILLFTISLLALAARPAAPQGVELELPTYRISIDSSRLDALYASPYSQATYPATFTFAGEDLSCQVRFRGATSRKYSKKSWKIKFPDRDNPFAVDELNLNAEYTDLSLMRNSLAMGLFQFLGQSAPNTSHISLIVNGTFMGVFVQVEEMEEDFLRGNNLALADLYKSEDHGGSTAPFLDL